MGTEYRGIPVLPLDMDEYDADADRPSSRAQSAGGRV
jgi:hypothetical protein